MFCITKSFQVKCLHYDSFGFGWMFNCNVVLLGRMHAYGSYTSKVPQIFIDYFVYHYCSLCVTSNYFFNLFKDFHLNFSFMAKWRHLTIFSSKVLIFFPIFNEKFMTQMGTHMFWRFNFWYHFYILYIVFSMKTWYIGCHLMDRWLMLHFP